MPKIGAMPSMELSAAGLELIKRWEGEPGTGSFSPRVYADVAGFPTVGYGHKLTAAEVARQAFKDGVDEATATALLRADAATAVGAVNRHVVVALTPRQFDALVSFVFNVGSGNFASSTALKKVNARDWAAVPAALAMFNKVRREGELVPSNGLTARRAAEGAMFLAGSPLP
ncbi:MAG: lysozyme [Deltaproteobacteria bacterium]|nr:lysozyme [Deltaproteobacteria bacterium]